MKTQTRTEEHRINELAEMRQRIAELEKANTERKQVEQALRKSEEQYRLLAENVTDVIWTMDMNLHFTYISHSVTRQRGYSVEEAMALGMERSLTPASLEVAAKVILEGLSAEMKGQKDLSRMWTVELEMYCKDGSTIWTEMEATFLHDPDGQAVGILGVSRDITERKRVGEKIEHLNTVLRAIRNVNQLITREKDSKRLIKGTCNELVETRGYFNAWITLLDESGRLVSTAEAGLGKDFKPMVEMLKRGELTDCGRRALKQSGVIIIEDPPSTCVDCPLARKYGDRGAMTVRLEYDGKVYGLMSVSMPRDLAAEDEEQALFREVAGDIAFALHNMKLEEERKQAEEALRESEEKLRVMFESTSEGIAVTDLKGKILDVNEAILRMSGLSREELVGQDGFGLMPRENGDKIIEQGTKALKGETGTEKMSHEITPTSGREYDVDLSIGVLRDSSGDPTGFVAIVRDITERKRTEEELRKHREHLEELVEERTKELQDAQERLVRTEKLAVIGQLAGGVSHELRNPLGAIKNTSYFLNIAIEQPEPEVKETLEILEKEVATSERIISSLLDFARPKPATLQNVHINEVIEESLYRVTVPENVEVVRHLDITLPIILADPGQLGQVFTNIILNAIQAMPEGGQLVIKSEVPGPKWVAVSFTDTGRGISEENMGKLFEPLFTTKAKGIGLGLAICRTMVEAHGGTIEVQSIEGKGSTFTISLPVGKKEKQ